jgi:hypothetical protein
LHEQDEHHHKKCGDERFNITSCNEQVQALQVAVAGLTKKQVRKSAIKLTKTEFEFASSEQYPLIKQTVIHKMTMAFGELGTQLRETLPVSSPLFANASSKITKGENYQGMPWVVVDIPKIAGRDFEVLYRTMFWWGRYFSLNALLSTNAFDLSNLPQWHADPALHNALLYTGDDIWQQNLDDPGFVPLKNIDAEQAATLRQSKPHIRISRKLSFSAINELEETALEFYASVGMAIGSQRYPAIR